MYERLKAYAPDGVEAVEKVYMDTTGAEVDLVSLINELTDDNPYAAVLRDWIVRPEIWNEKFYALVSEGLLHSVDIDDLDYKLYQDRYFQNDNSPAFHF